MNIAILIDNNEIEKWQLNSILNIDSNIKIKNIYICKNSKFRRNIISNFLYYFYNYFFINNKFRNKINIKRIKEFEQIPKTSFFSLYKKNWQIIPRDICESFINQKINLIIKFGLNLLHIDDNLKDISVLSFHHGDPDLYRGKAPCFYEILNKSSYQGVIVQKLNNNLDKGEVLAEAKLKLYNYSYKQSLINCYRSSIPLLSKAIENYKSNTFIKKKFNSKVNKLPSNIKFIQFLWLLLFNKLKRIIYLLFFIRSWKISISRYNGIKDFDLITKSLQIKSFNHIFFADPFFLNKKNIILEGFNYFKGRGEILKFNLENNKITNFLCSKFHLSYPFIFKNNNESFLIPEISNSKKPTYFKLSNIDNSKKLLSDPKKFFGLEKYKIIDPTLLKYNNEIYMFCNLKGEPIENLYIFISDKIDGFFKPHKLNPIIININSSRMAGDFIQEKGNIYRLGQNNSDEYGNGITINKICTLDRNQYKETFFGKIELQNKFGPHTFNVFDNKCVFDHYYITFNFFAFFHRFLQFINRYINR